MTTEDDPTASFSESLAETLRALAHSVSALAASVRADSHDELLTADELAERFRIPARTIKDQASAGQLPHHRLGKHYRFNKDDIAEILRQTQFVPTTRPERTRTVRAA